VQEEEEEEKKEEEEESTMLCLRYWRRSCQPTNKNQDLNHAPGVSHTFSTQSSWPTATTPVRYTWSVPALTARQMTHFEQPA
jgi:hypothetical protein